MRRSLTRGAGVLMLTVGISACHLNRPGEYRPRIPEACEQEHVRALAERPGQLSEAEKEVLESCRRTVEVESLRAMEEHEDYRADLSTWGFILSGAATLVAIADLVW